MTTSTPDDRFVFDAPQEKAATVYSAETVADNAIVVTDDAICNVVDGASMPNQGDYITVAAFAKVYRGRMVQHAYLIEVAT